MSILDDIRAEEKMAGAKCSTCQWLQERPEDEREQWETHLADATIKVSPITRAMQKHGFPHGRVAVARHRDLHT